MEEREVILELSHITKSFPGVQALDDGNFRLKKGTVHVLCGGNGAGKPTLMKIIDGIYKPDQGDMVINGQEVVIKAPCTPGSMGSS